MTQKPSPRRSLLSLCLPLRALSHPPSCSSSPPLPSTTPAPYPLAMPPQTCAFRERYSVKPLLVERFFCPMLVMHMCKKPTSPLLFLSLSKKRYSSNAVWFFSILEPPRSPRSWSEDSLHPSRRELHRKKTSVYLQVLLSTEQTLKKKIESCSLFVSLPNCDWKKATFNVSI